MSPHSITIETADLHQLVKPILPIAGFDPLLPSIYSVRFQVRDRHLIASATDRYRLGISRHLLDDDANTDVSAEFDALLGYRDLKHLLSLFKADRRNQAAVKLTIDGDRLHAQAAGGFNMTFADLQVSYTLLDEKQPNLWKLIRERLDDTSEPSGDVSINPAFLADFKLADRDRTGLNIVGPTATNKALLITAGDHFIGLLMSRSRVEATAPVAFWTELLAATDEKKNEAA